MRDLLVKLAIYGVLPFVPFRPFFGLLVFSWLAYMRPQDLAWGLSDQRFSMLVAAGTLFGMLFVLDKEKLFAIRLQTLLMVALSAWVGVASLTAVLPYLARDQTVLLAKVILISLLTTGLVRSRYRLRWMMLVIAFSLGLLGAKYGVYGVLRGGAEFVWGPGGFMQDRNAFAVALNMGIPLLSAVFLTEKSPWVRGAALACAGLSSLAILFTFSRGGLLTLLLVLLLLTLRSGRIVLAGSLATVGLLMALVFTGDKVKSEYFDRAQTLSSVTEDESAMGRIREWKTAGRVARDFPIFGVGPNNLQVVHARYADRPEEYLVSHNSYLQLLVEAGFPAMFLFLGMLGTALWKLSKVAARPNDLQLRTYAQMIQISLLAFMAGGTLLNLAYFDLVYHLVALSVCLELVESLEDDLPMHDAAPVQSSEKWWKQPRTGSVHG